MLIYEQQMAEYAPQVDTLQNNEEYAIHAHPHECVKKKMTTSIVTNHFNLSQKLYGI